MKTHKSQHRIAGVVGDPNSQQATSPRGRLADQQLPDMIAWSSEAHGFLYDWYIDSNEPLMPGRTLLRLTNAVANIGNGPLELRGGSSNPDGTQEVFQRIYQRRTGFEERLAGSFEFHPTHGHIHFEDFAQYNLLAVTDGNGVGEPLATGEKVSFCLLDVEQYDGPVAGSPNSEAYSSCDQVQGISVGWADVYDSSLADQWIDITDVADGTYWLESIVDPSNRIVESNEANNVIRIMITLGPPPADDFPNTLADATPITLSIHSSGTQVGRIEPKGDADVFSFVASRKGRMRITQASSGGRLDSLLTVYNSTGQEIAQDDDSGGDLNSRVKFRVLPGQKYFVKAGSIGSGTGQYTLTFK